MLENIINLDQYLFYIINVQMANPVTNFIMPILTDIKFWIPFFAIFAVYQFWKGGANGRICIITIIVGVILCDQINSSIIKEIVQRPRPCHFLSDINLLVNCGAGKSFPSSHAANSMMAITIIVLYFRKYKYWLPLLSVIIGFSRIFVGVHFPFDILAGWIVGIGIGFGTYYAVKLCANKILDKMYPPPQT